MTDMERSLVFGILDATKEEKEERLVRSLENTAKLSNTDQSFEHNYMMDVANNLFEINKTLKDIYTELKRMRRK